MAGTGTHSCPAPLRASWWARAAIGGGVGQGTVGFPGRRVVSLAGSQGPQVSGLHPHVRLQVGQATLSAPSPGGEADRLWGGGEGAALSLPPPADAALESTGPRVLSPSSPARTPSSKAIWGWECSREVPGSGGCLC